MEIESQPVIQPESLNIEQLEAKKKKFYKKVKLLALVGVIGVVIVIVSTALLLRVDNGSSPYTAPETEKPSNEQPFPIEEDPETPWDLFKSDRFLFSVEYPHADDFRELEILDPNSTTYQISFAKTQPTDKIGTQDITDGYFVQITPKKITNLNTLEAANVKKQNFATTCPNIVELSNVMPVVVVGTEGHYFTAKNCNADYWIAYVPFGQYMFEIVRATKGDIGYKQAYETVTQTIVDSVKFLDNSINEELPPALTYKSDLGFSVTYPSYLNTTCCEVPKPPMQNLTTHIIVAETETKKGLGFFTEFIGDKLSLEEYVEKQKQILIDEYTVVKGGQPQGEMVRMNIKEHDAYLLKGYSWRDNDILYVKLARGQLLAISDTGINSDLYNTIIDSIEIDKFEK